MGRLKKDHSGYHTSGLYLKYQQPSVYERPAHRSNKKNTSKWCRGKVGVPHEYHRYQSKRYRWRDDDYVWDWIKAKCVECGKVSYKRRSYDAPLHAFVYSESERTQIQVRVNGKIIPFDAPRYDGSWWCSQCRCYHSY
jgi:hypothetical protein